MSIINIILLSSTFGLVLCLNPIRRRPIHVRQRQAQKRAQAKKAAGKWNAGRV